jgi:hypothetical protein
LHLFVSLFWVTINGNKNYPTFSWNAERMNERKKGGIFPRFVDQINPRWCCLYLSYLLNDQCCVSPGWWCSRGLKKFTLSKEKEKTSYTN